LKLLKIKLMKAFVILFAFLLISFCSFAQNSLKHIEYWFDSNFAELQTHDLSDMGISDYQWDSALETDALSYGLHSLNIRILDKNMAYSVVQSAFFLKSKSTNGEPVQIKGFEYWFDGQIEDKEFVLQSESETTKQLDVSALKKGLHIIHFRFLDTNGKWSVVNSSFFSKTNASNNRDNLIDAYEYWFDSLVAESVNKDLNEPVNPYELISDIQTPVMSLGTHKFNIRFRDLTGKWSVVYSQEFDVNHCSLAKAQKPTGDSELCADIKSTDYKTRKIEQADSYLWTILPDTAGTITVEDTVAHIEWNPNFTGEAKLSVQAENICGQGESSDTIIIMRKALPAKPSVFSGDTAEFCEGDSIVLTAPDGFEYLWSDYSDNDSLIVKESGNYYLRILDENLCANNSDTVHVIVNDKPHRPSIIAYGEELFCKGDSVELGVNNEIKFNYSYLWSTDETTETIYAKESGNYSMKYISDKSCQGEWSYPVEINVNELPEKPVITQHENELVSSEAFTYQWYKSLMPVAGLVPVDGEINQEYHPDENGKYAVEVSNEASCKVMSDELEFQLTAIESYEANNLKVFPNPGNGMLNIEFTETIEELYLFNASGIRVYNNTVGKSNFQINFTNFNGVYLLQLKVGNKIINKKILIQ